MLTLSKILFPIDFSEYCQHAAHYVVSVAELFHSEITLLHVLLPAQDWVGAPEVGTGMVTDFWETRRSAAETQLSSYLKEELKGLPVKRVLVDGDPGREIVRYAEENTIDLIVLPTHGYGLFRRFLLGSVTAKVLHDSKCPVLTGAHLEEAPEVTRANFDSVLCAIDLREHSKETLRWAAAIARQYKARLTVVHATSPGDPSVGGIYVDPDFDLKLRELAEKGVEDLLVELGVEGDILVRAGDPSKVVHSVAEEVKADLVVIGRATGGLLGRLRAHAYAIIRESPCPVMSV